MLLIPLYHRIDSSGYSNRLDTFSAHLRFVADHYPVVLPGDPLPGGEISVCLTFDDASFDFYHYVFPLLRELRLKALLGVPAKYIVEKTALDPRTRLSVPYDEAMADEVYKAKVPFCTWAEMSEMTSGGLVEVASHSFSHANLVATGVDLAKEIAGSKQIIEAVTGRPVSTFVYPFGKVNSEVHLLAKKHYSYEMRIGSAINIGWRNPSGMLYRVHADDLPYPSYPFKKRKLLGYLLKYFSNTIRGK